MPVKPKVPKTKPEDEAPEPADADSEFVEIKYRANTFIIPRDRGDWSTKALAFLAENKYNLFAKYLLDTTLPGQWDAVTALCPRRRDFAAFYVELGKASRECVN